MSRFFICQPQNCNNINVNNVTVVISNNVHIRGNYKEPTDGKFDDRTSEILKNLAAEGSSASESNAVEDN